jgi:hypothetical protein
MKPAVRSILLTMLLSAAGFLIFCLDGCKETRKEIVAPAYLDPTIHPTVVATYPPNGGVGPFNVYSPVPQDGGYPSSGIPHFIVQFSMPMYWPTNISGTTSFVSDDGRKFTVTRGPFTYGPSDVLGFSLYDSLGACSAVYRKGAVVHITIDTTFIGANGLSLNRPYSFSFEPEPYFRVTGTFPRPDEVMNDAYGDIYIQFNSTVNNSILRGIHISPPVSGEWNFRKDSTGCWIYPDGGFLMDTTYHVIVDQTVHDKDSVQLRSPTDYRFSTSSFQPVYSSPTDGENDFMLWQSVYIDFNADVDTASLRVAMTISPPCRYSLIKEYSSHNIRIVPLDDFVPLTSYTISLDTSLKANNNSHLKRPWNLNFTTSEFRVDTTYYWLFTGQISRWGTLNIPFTSRIDERSLDNSISLSPSLASKVSLDPWQQDLVINPDSVFTPGEYKCTIDTTLRSIGGYHLRRPFVFTFVVK